MMPRAKRYFLKGYIWHITQRCHKRQFLLRFAKDRKRWIQWLYDAKKRYGLIVLNYNVTSNHIHLLVKDKGNETISKSLQLVAGRTAQEYNQRKPRSGAFWNDRYHATAVESGHHLRECMAYIDLNMVRNGVVKHPCQWPFSGYHEIHHYRKRYTIIDKTELMRCLKIDTQEQLIKGLKEWTNEKLAQKDLERQEKWTKSIAVGSTEFLEEIQSHLRSRGSSRQIDMTEGLSCLREPPQKPYGMLFVP